MKRLSIVLLACLAAVATGSAAFAQGTVASDARGAQANRRPYRGLFDRGVQDQQKQGSSLHLSGSAYGAYDDNLLASVQNKPTTPSKEGGFYSGVNTSLEYQWLGQDSTFRVDGGGGWRFYENELSTLPVYFESADINTKLGSRTNVSLAQSFLYSEVYRFNLFPGMGGIDNPDAGAETEGDLDLFDSSAYRHTLVGNVNYALNRRSRLYGTYALRYVDFVTAGVADYRNQGVGGGYDYDLTSHATLQLGYLYRTASHVGEGVAEIPPVHNINIGVNYSRALSLSRRTTFSFSTGSAIVSKQTDTPDGTTTNSRFNLVGSAELQRELGRSWTFAIGYDRGLLYREGYSEPLLRDGAVASLSGLLSRRLEASLVAQYADATLAVSGGGGHEAFSASAQLQYALGRNWATFVRFFHYDYDFYSSNVTSTWTSSSASRNGIRVGLTAGVPLIR